MEPNLSPFFTIILGLALLEFAGALTCYKQLRTTLTEETCDYSDDLFHCSMLYDHAKGKKVPDGCLP